MRFTLARKLTLAFVALVLLNVAIATIINGSVASVNTEQAAKLSDLLAITAVRESSLTGAELWSYIKYLQSNGLESDRYEIAFWNRIATVAGIAVMCMLALPFVLGPLRSTGAGARMLIGTFIGIGYFLLSLIFFVSLDTVAKHLSQIYPPIEVAWGRYIFALAILPLILGISMWTELSTISETSRPR